MAETLENPSASDMEIEAAQADAEDMPAEENGAGSKRSMEECAAAAAADEEPENEEDGDPAAKKPKVEKSVEEQRLEKREAETKEKDGSDESGRASLGPKCFGSSVEMYDYFMKLLHCWTPSVNINKYEHIVLLELLKKGHLEPEKKIGKGIRVFQVRYHPQFKSRCFFLIREDESVDDFSFRKCVDHILPLPENMQTKLDVNRSLGGRGRGGGHGRGRGHGRGKSRN